MTCMTPAEFTRDAFDNYLAKKREATAPIEEQCDQQMPQRELDRRAATAHADSYRSGCDPEPTPSAALERLKAYRPLADVARGPAGLALGADGIEQDGAPPPAASDLRERAMALSRFRPVGAGDGETYAATTPTPARVEAEFAAIRAEAKAEGWEDAVKALRARFGFVSAADWLAANRPSPTGREEG